MPTVFYDLNTPAIFVGCLAWLTLINYLSTPLVTNILMALAFLLLHIRHSTYRQKTRKNLKLLVHELEYRTRRLNLAESSCKKLCSDNKYLATRMDELEREVSKAKAASDEINDLSLEKSTLSQEIKELQVLLNATKVECAEMRLEAEMARESENQTKCQLDIELDFLTFKMAKLRGCLLDALKLTTCPSDKVYSDASSWKSAESSGELVFSIIIFWRAIYRSKVTGQQSSVTAIEKDPANDFSDDSDD